MSVDPDLVAMTSTLNSFKNNGVYRNTIAMPTSHVSGTEDVRSVTFTLAEDTDFIQLLVFATDYGDYFRFLDSNYHDAWLPVESVETFLLLPGGSILYFTMDYKIVNNVVTVSLRIPAFFSTQSYPARSIKVAFVEYTLAA